jgi:hypothetical protein
VFLVIIGSKRKIYDYNHIKDKVMRIKLELSIREETALMVKAEKKVLYPCRTLERLHKKMLIKNPNLNHFCL